MNITGPIDAALKRFESHPSILRINEDVYMTAFTFNTITLEDVELEIRKMNPNKASASNSIPVICCPFIHHILNHAILGCAFPNKLKLADIAPTHKKDNNCRPINMLPAVSKIFEWMMQIQVYEWLQKRV